MHAGGSQHSGLQDEIGQLQGANSGALTLLCCGDKLQHIEHALAEGLQTRAHLEQQVACVVTFGEGVLAEQPLDKSARARIEQQIGRIRDVYTARERLGHHASAKTKDLPRAVPRVVADQHAIGAIDD